MDKKDKRIKELENALRPFALFTNAAEEMSGNPEFLIYQVVSHKHQSLNLAAFQNARQVLNGK